MSKPAQPERSSGGAAPGVRRLPLRMLQATCWITLGLACDAQSPATGPTPPVADDRGDAASDGLPWDAGLVGAAADASNATGSPSSQVEAGALRSADPSADAAASDRPGRDAGADPTPAADAAPDRTRDGGRESVEAGADGSGSVDAATGEPCPPLEDFVEPTRLSQTGLYRDPLSGELAEGVYQYAPRYELWSDGALKRRFVKLPPCSTIDSSDADFWSYPPGTKLWKEFVSDNHDGEPVRVETRLIQKYTATKWFMTAFIWNDEQSDALAGPDDDESSFVLQENANGTSHDVPGRGACFECHGGMRDKVLGFSALQLAHPAPDGYLTLERLIASGKLSDPPPRSMQLPGDALSVAAVGYLHANCGHCHNPNSQQANLGLELWARAAALDGAELTTAYTTTVGIASQSSSKPAGQPELRVVPGSPEQSALYWRMVQPPVFPSEPRGGVHMPLIGTELTDEAGVALVRDWILNLP